MRRALEATHCEPAAAADLLELAWGLIANAGNSDWTTESAEWQEAAVRWRDEYHELIGARRIEVPKLEEPR